MQTILEGISSDTSKMFIQSGFLRVLHGLTTVHAKFYFEEKAQQHEKSLEWESKALSSVLFLDILYASIPHLLPGETETPNVGSRGQFSTAATASHRPAPQGCEYWG